ncbi:hypothetical protein GCM10029976_031510 [Kribbella albertanoniae]|uniref:DUF305 domain-containing protein n=1 Tax=Kribbella albertanoniae TaxID=1266829 RepID=A0A4V2XSU1_9ACTN|nr:DUF305 domain-containing protein [Kribbella albertanoniae]TDC35025.1 DUF305 domain-containing protein [Kribbella albertanoniae]
MRTSCALRCFVVATTAALAVVLAGCADIGADSGETSHLPVNAVDIAFAQRMMAQHRQAVDMSALATTRSKNSAVIQLASTIGRTHADAIGELDGLLKAWGPTEQPTSPPASDPGPAGATPPVAVSGVIVETDLARLRASSGVVFDQLLLGLLIDHHREDVSTARLEQEAGQNRRARGIADRIEADHTAELSEMRKLLSSLGTVSR